MLYPAELRARNGVALLAEFSGGASVLQTEYAGRTAQGMTRLAILLPLAALPLTASCARDNGTYPSLAQRPAEKRGFAEPEAPPTAPIAADPTLDARIATIQATLATIVTGFDRDAAKATAGAARSGARTIGSDAWLDAQTALASLDDWRAQASSLATDADGLASARAATLAPPYPAVERVRTAAAAEVARQDAAIRGLSARLPGT